MDHSNDQNNRLKLETVDWYQVLPRFGVDLDLIKNPKKLGPCPIEGEGKTRFRFENKDGRGNWFCNNCGAGDAVKLIALLHGCSNTQAIFKIRELDNGKSALPIRKQMTQSEKTPKDVSKIRNGLQRVWDGSKNIDDLDPTGIYLKRRVPMLDTKWLSTSLRFNANLYHFDEGERKKSYFPAMVGRVTSVDGLPITLHRTYLSEDGFKAHVSPDQVKKQMTGVSTLHGECIHLNTPVLQSRVLYVSEGIETGLAMVAALQNRHEVWSALNAGNLSKLKVPRDKFDRILIIADKDCMNPKHGWRPGEHYAEIAKIRLQAEGFNVTVKVPEKEGTDYLDLWVDYCKQNLMMA